ncbi:MAG: ABC transporter permease [Chloroflexi bacterium]|nr:ABC transporter permease [Chloroflexota bacterium]
MSIHSTVAHDVPAFEWERRPRRRAWLQAIARFGARKPLGAAGIVIIMTMAAMAVLAPLVSPFDPNYVRAQDRLRPPDVPFFFGTDQLGRDVLSRIIWGARISLFVGFISVGIGTGAGSLLGIVSGYWGGAPDMFIQRGMDALMAFPTLILALVIMSVLGIGIANAMIAIGIVMAPQMGRVVRGAVLSVKQSQYVDAARAIGASDFRIVYQHIVPNVTAPVVILATAGLGTAILTEASLSFLGFGTPPNVASWGADLSSAGRAFLEQAPWLGLFPGIAISLAVLGFNLLGDALRDIWDPRLRASR